MKFVTFERAGAHVPGIALGEDILDLGRSASLIPAARLAPCDILGLLQAGEAGLDLAREIIEAAGARAEELRAMGALVPRASVNLAPPLPNPGMILAVGANYHEHLKEMNSPAPPTPMCFQKSIPSLTGDGGDIVLPPDHGDMVDWEGEFTAVIGKPCHRVSEARALDYVAGYTISNDVSARDWVTPAFAASGLINTVVAWEHNILGKLYPTFCPMGPCIVTSDEIGDPHDLALETRLNGVVMQKTRTSDLVFNVAQIVSWYSRFFAFRPGDVILTGSPSGVGFGRSPKVFMKAGDRIEVEVEKIGILRNKVVSEDAT